MDLLYHAGAGFIVSGLIVLLFAHRNKETHIRPDRPMIVAAILPLLIGFAKEAYDKWIGPGTPEMADVTLTWFGGLGAMFLILIIDLFRTDKY
ncbi:MAG TPA: hypothetical protein PL069_11840 [Saprospiraceae bacterium]|jgi:hypothetical protein|nr:hypothetical protein [Saprospiraceae bacterium]